MVAEQARAQRTPMGPGMFSASAAAAQVVTSGWSRARDRDANRRTVSSLEVEAPSRCSRYWACGMTCGMRVRLIGIRPPRWLSRWWDRRRCGARAAMTRRVRVGVMTVRSASHPSGPSLVVGVSSVHGVSRAAADVDVGAVRMPSAVANAPARSAGGSGGRRPQRGPRSPLRASVSLGQVGHPGCQLWRRADRRGGAGAW
jgi:hypothetical protein